MKSSVAMLVYQRVNLILVHCSILGCPRNFGDGWQMGYSRLVNGVYWRYNPFTNHWSFLPTGHPSGWTFLKTSNQKTLENTTRWPLMWGADPFWRKERDPPMDVERVSCLQSFPSRQRHPKTLIGCCGYIITIYLYIDYPVLIRDYFIIQLYESLLVN